MNIGNALTFYCQNNIFATTDPEATEPGSTSSSSRRRKGRRAWAYVWVFGSHLGLSRDLEQSEFLSYRDETRES